jgi:hypothetical protein
MNGQMAIRSDRGELALWIAAIAVAALGAWVMFDALPGINWVAWTTAAAAGLFLFIGPQGARTIWITSATAVVIALGASVTSDEFISALICLSVILFLAMSMLLASNPNLRRITASFTIPSPVVAFATAIVESIKRGIAALQLVRSDRARSIVRGIVITAPIVIIFGLLLSVADPTFAGWREAIYDLLSSWEFLPRTIFFIGLLALTLGAYGYAERESAPPSQLSEPVDRNRWLGSTERLILLGSIAALFWIFLAFQLSYLFGNLPHVTGSGVTFADYARRGFGELTVVASASVILVLLSERYGRSDGRDGLLRAATLALIVGVLFLLVSAFNRVLLYEAAYGYTTARLYAQCYMIVVAVILIALAWELRGTLESGRLFRISLGVATAMFIVLIYWNHSAWIADRNIDRLATTGKLDVDYLAKDLSPDAIPTMTARLASIPEPSRSALTRALFARYSGRERMFNRRWFEWNYRISKAHDELLRLGVPLQQAPRPPRAQ